MQAPTGSTTGTDERSSASSPLQQATETPALKPYNGGGCWASLPLSLSLRPLTISPDLDTPLTNARRGATYLVSDLVTALGGGGI